MRVTVIGAGVIGLSCALRLVERGHRVTVLSAEEPAATTSAVAGGLVFPHLVNPPDRCLAWTATSTEVYAALAAQPDTGVRLRAGRLLLRTPQADPWWGGAASDLTRLVDLPAPYQDGFAFTAPLVDMTRYLPWLDDESRRRGVVRLHRRLTSLDEAVDKAELVVNASGVGAAEVAGDPDVTPVRGQVVRVANPGLTEWVVDDEHPGGVTYVIPHERHVVCGGTEDAGDADRTPDPATTADILARCVSLVPALAGAEVLDTVVGLRPYRPEVRLERDSAVIHCYGHGGAGVTLSWGCAAEVADLAG